MYADVPRKSLCGTVFQELDGVAKHVHSTVDRATPAGVVLCFVASPQVIPTRLKILHAIIRCLVSTRQFAVVLTELGESAVGSSLLIRHTVTFSPLLLLTRPFLKAEAFQWTQRVRQVSLRLLPRPRKDNYKPLQAQSRIVDRWVSER